MSTDSAGERSARWEPEYTALKEEVAATLLASAERILPGTEEAGEGGGCSHAHYHRRYTGNWERLPRVAAYGYRLILA